MTRHSQPRPLLDASVRLDQVPPAGQTLDVEATPRQRAEIAAQLGISTLEALRARLIAARFQGGIRVAGTVEARIVQPCVLTLVPVTQDIEEPFDRLFLPADQMRTPAHTPGAEVFVDLEAAEEPDRFEGTELDLSGALIETVALAIDPYPRAPGAELGTFGDPPGPQDSPFAKLRSLKS